jgi:hypothetical protein
MCVHFILLLFSIIITVVIIIYYLLLLLTARTKLSKYIYIYNMFTCQKIVTDRFMQLSLKNKNETSLNSFS